MNSDSAPRHFHSFPRSKSSSKIFSQGNSQSASCHASSDTASGSGSGRKLYVCFWCGDAGHIITHCRKKEQGLPQRARGVRKRKAYVKQQKMDCINVVLTDNQGIVFSCEISTKSTIGDVKHIIQSELVSIRVLVASPQISLFSSHNPREDFKDDSKTLEQCDISKDGLVISFSVTGNVLIGTD